MNQILKIIFFSMLPINELRGTIPLAISVYRFSPIEAFFWATLGNILPIFFLLWFWNFASNFLMKKNNFFHRIFSWLFEMTRKKHNQSFEKWGALALVAFVAIPLPLTGAWTGSVAAFVFGVKYFKALALIFLGVLIAGIIVTLASTGVISFLKIF